MYNALLQQDEPQVLHHQLGEDDRLLGSRRAPTSTAAGKGPLRIVQFSILTPADFSLSQAPRHLLLHACEGLHILRYEKKLLERLLGREDVIVLRVDVVVPAEVVVSQDQ